MELKDYKSIIVEDVKFASVSEMNFEKEEFLRLMTDELIEHEELVDFTPCHFEGYGSKNRKFEIDGYTFDSADDSVCIIINDYNFSDNIETITKTEIDKMLDRAKVFVREAMSGRIIQEAEESSQGYGFAVELYHKLKASKISKLRFYIISDRVLSNRVKQIISDEYLDIRTEYNVWDLFRFFTLSESKSGKEEIIIDFKEFTKNGITCLSANLKNENEYKSYMCALPGDLLADLYNTYGGRLLEGNVRSFLTTRGKVNKKIRVTILNNPEMFFAYNNGIAVTALQATVEVTDGQNYITSMNSMQIVNGGQTTASLALAKLKDKADLSKIFVPMKLSVVTPEKAEIMIPNISRYANSQNKVSEADFFSNAPFHIRIEGFSRRIYAPAVEGDQFGKRWYYERARGQYNQEQAKMTAGEKKSFKQRNPKNQVFKKTDLAKYCNSYFGFPHFVSMGAQRNFMHFASIIDKQWNNNDKVFHEEFYKKCITLAIIFKTSEKMVSRQEWYNGGYRANIVTYTIALLFSTIKKNTPNKFFDFKKVWIEQKISDATLNQLKLLAKIVYDSITAPSGVQNVTEWCKRKECWTRILLAKIKLNEDFINELMLKSDNARNERDAIKDQDITNKIFYQIEVVKIGASNWRKLLIWGTNHKVLNLKDADFLKVATKLGQNNIPSDKQCKVILGIRKRLIEDEGYPVKDEVNND